MATPSPTWRDGAKDLAGTIARSERPVTFLIGAGASISSGAPTTGDVFRAFEQATRGRIPPGELKAFLHTISERDKQDVLAPLFQDVSPYIGYRCMAALGRHRRVNVLNLNWDTALEQACRELGVRHLAFDLNDARARKAIGDLDGPGLAIAHIHGKIGQECRFEALRTLRFSDGETRFLRKHFLGHTMIVAGASVVHDTDLQALLLDARARGGADDGHMPAQWYFGRPDDSSALDAMRRAQLPAGILNYFLGKDVDFDELMVQVLSSVLKTDWNAVRRYRPSLGLPEFESLVWPRPSLLRPLLGSDTIALLGHARLGKSVAAHLLAYLQALWHSEGPWPEGDFPLRGVDGPSDSVAALSGVQSGEVGSYVIDNPFGAGRLAEENPAFKQALARLDGLPGREAKIVIASRLNAWPDAGIEQHVTTSASSPADWYAPEDLRTHLERVAPERQDVLDQIGPHGIRIPVHLRDALAGVPFSAREREDDEAEVVDKLTLLEGNETLAQFCAILRLQEFCAELLTREDLETLIGTSLEAVPFQEVVSHRFMFEGAFRWRLGHDTDREAVDILLSRRAEEVMSRLPPALAASEQMRRAFAEWRLVERASTEHWEEVLTASPTALRACAPDLVRIPSIQGPIITLLSQQAYDDWDIKDLSYELIRVWSRLGDRPEGRELLQRILADRRASGAYAVLEACLYMQRAASDELWRKVYTVLDDLVFDPDARAELALAVDALTWRPPPEPYRSPSWARKFIHSLSPAEPSWALVRFLVGYHGGGLSLLDVGELIESDSTYAWTPAQAGFAAWLVRWHFIHQSRARAQFARQPWVDKDFLCRSLHPEPKEVGHAAMNRLLRSFLGHPDQAGWGFFLGCNAAAIGHGIDTEGARLTAEALRAAPPASQGVIAAALTYDTASRYGDDLKRYFASDVNREALLDGMRDGLEIDGLSLRPPRFIVNRAPMACYQDVGIGWGNLRESLVTVLPLNRQGQLDLPALSSALRTRLDGLAENQRGRGVEILRRVEGGDLRLLDAAAAARGHATRPGMRPAASDPLLGLLNRAVSLLAAELWAPRG